MPQRQSLVAYNAPPTATSQNFLSCAGRLPPPRHAARAVQRFSALYSHFCFRYWGQTPAWRNLLQDFLRKLRGQTPFCSSFLVQILGTGPRNPWGQTPAGGCQAASDEDDAAQKRSEEKRRRFVGAGGFEGRRSAGARAARPVRVLRRQVQARPGRRYPADAVSRRRWRMQGAGGRAAASGCGTTSPLKPPNSTRVPCAACFAAVAERSDSGRGGLRRTRLRA